MQLDLLADTPRARRNDPETSHRAAARIKASGALGRQQALVLDYVRRFPGHTSAELARRMAEARDGVLTLRRNGSSPAVLRTRQRNNLICSGNGCAIWRNRF